MRGRRMPVRTGGSATPASSPTQLVAVSYDAGTMAGKRPQLVAREAALGTTLNREMTFTHAKLVTRVLSVPSAQVASVEAGLRGQPGVRAVGLTGTRKYASGVTSPYFTTDPYFAGLSGTSAPLYETGVTSSNPGLPGQWDMHVIRLEYAFGYSQPNNGPFFNGNALGANTVKIAVIDTGEDTTHPELASKIQYTRCFITSPTTNNQSTSNYTTDGDGHGTDVSGIAAAEINNGLGFVGAGGNVVIYAYRIFPTPYDACANTSSSDSQCSSNSNDLASAIKDAVSNKVNVINLSLGSGTCSNGQDTDPVEGGAIADATAANIVVVAAAGNAKTPGVEAPACDPGVIAVGATSLADGSPNASGKTGGSPSSPFEYVTSYTDYGSPGASPGLSSAWGIVAPGGDATDGNDEDNLHWIFNIWTSTPYMLDGSDSNFEGDCSPDDNSSTSTIDCRTLIAGTSQATPHVAGAAALILSVAPQYQSPTAMKQLLCNTADDIGDSKEGCGRLDIYRAMAVALGDADPGPQATP